MKRIFNNTWSVLTNQERKKFTLQVILDILISLADIVFLVALLWIINFYIQPETIKRISSLPGWLMKTDIVLLISVFVLLFAIKNIAAYFILRAHFTFTSRVAVRLSANSLDRYLRADFDKFIHTDSSAWIRSIALQPFDFAQQVLSSFQQVIAQLILITITVLAILLFNAKLFLLLLLILVPGVILVFFFIRKRLSKIKRDLRNNNERSYQYLLDTLKGYVEANVYQRQDFFLNRFIRYRQQFSSNLFASISLQNLPGRVIEIFAITGLFILVLIAEWTGNTSQNTLITIGAFMAAAYKIIPGMVKLVNLSGQIKAYEFSTEELKPVTGYEKKVSVASQANIHSLEFKNVSFRYGVKNILKELSFSAAKGDLLGIYGESGIGKTTIMNLVLGFLEPASGDILINNTAINSEMRQQFWPAIAYARQQSFFIYDTIEKNITLQEDRPDETKLAYALKVSGLDRLITGFPEGLQKIISENGKNISGGQQQRIILARAIYKDADLLLLDEPLNELDDPSSAWILEQLKELSNKGKIIIMITHDKKSLAYCHKIISID
ncbi:MAG TPA: ABC transporter ATP-binding protein [Chitinophagaceae bacterium]|nr:ABC transporter ATP-binding protein [Chitinophagaceae bacterium]